MIIIGVVGHPSSGKDTAAEFFAAKGYTHISTGDILRSEMRALGLPLDRSNVSAFADRQRAKFGNGYPADRLDKIVTGDTVVSGMRTTAEVEVLRNAFRDTFTLIAVEASLRARYDRAKARNRVGDDISFEKFCEEEEKERHKNGAGTQEVEAVIALADLTVPNDGTKEEFIAALEAVETSLTRRS